VKRIEAGRLNKPPRFLFEESANLEWRVVTGPHGANRVQKRLAAGWQTGGLFMRIFLISGAVLALSACGSGNDTQANGANMTTTDNMTRDQNITMDQNMAMDPMMNGAGNMGMDPMMNGTANGTMNSTTENMMQQDMNSNDPDTNLANGM
jgi:hypothetical protein